MKRTGVFIAIVLAGVFLFSLAAADQVSFDSRNALLTVECVHAEAGQAVSFIAVHGREDSYTIGQDTVHYIRQLKTDETGSVSISFIGTLTDDYVFLLGGIGEKNAPHVIGSFSIADMDKLRLPASMTSIMEEAFMDNISLKIVVINPGMKSIGSRAFKGCSNLFCIEIPDTVEYIGEDVFDGCEGLTICCVEGSPAYNYAVANNIPFQPFGE